MKTNDQIEQAFIEAVGTPQKATQETVAQACEAVLAKATAVFGPGVYVNGKLNADMQGISFRYKRPAIRQRLEFFVPVAVDKPPRKKDIDDDAKTTSQKKSKKAKQEDNAGNDDAGASGSPQDDAPVDRLMILEAAASDLSDDDFMGDGRPHVDAVNDQLEEGVEPFTASERDELWAQRAGE